MNSTKDVTSSKRADERRRRARASQVYTLGRSEHGRPSRPSHRPRDLELEKGTGHIPNAVGPGLEKQASKAADWIGKGSLNEILKPASLSGIRFSHPSLD